MLRTRQSVTPRGAAGRRSRERPASGNLKPSELRAVALERLPVAVMLPALKLDDEPSLWPVGVDEKALDEDVQLRERESGLADQVEEPRLQVGFRFDRLARVVVEQGKSFERAINSWTAWKSRSSCRSAAS